MARTVSEQFGTLWNVSDAELKSRAADLAGEGYGVGVELFDVCDYNGCFDTLAMLRSGTPVLVRVEDVPGEIKAELMDFLCGAAFAVDATVERVRPGSFIFLPRGAQVSDDEIWHALYK